MVPPRTTDRARGALGLLRSRRRAELPGAEVFLSTTALLHPRFRVHLVHNAGVTSEDALSLRAFERKGATGRPTWTLLLEGAARISAFGEHRWLGPGSMLGVARKGAICMRQQGSAYRSVVLEWDPGSLCGELPASLVAARVGGEALGELRAAALALDEGADPGPGLSALLGLLQRAGAPFEPGSLGALPHSPPEGVVRLSQALDEVLSSAGMRPTSVDLEERMGLSARQLNRLIDRYNRLYGFNAEGWRDTVNRRRVMLGAALMTSPGASVGRVSSAMGFSSPEVFARALADAGLPPPSEIAAEIARLGAEHPPGPQPPRSSGAEAAPSRTISEGSRR